MQRAGAHLCSPEAEPLDRPGGCRVSVGVF